MQASCRAGHNMLDLARQMNGVCATLRTARRHFQIDNMQTDYRKAWQKSCTGVGQDSLGEPIPASCVSQRHSSERCMQSALGCCKRLQGHYGARCPRLATCLLALAPPAHNPSEVRTRRFDLKVENGKSAAMTEVSTPFTS